MSSCNRPMALGTTRRNDPATPDFKNWLKTELRASSMTLRQLALRSGVHYSTISRLLREARNPSLGTVAKLMSALHAHDAGPTYFSGSTSTFNPTARVEYALRADDELSEQEVRQLMRLYLAVRMRHPTPHVAPTPYSKG